MPVYTMESLERWLLRARYEVAAANKEEADAKVRSGDAHYRGHSIIQRTVVDDNLSPQEETNLRQRVADLERAEGLLRRIWEAADRGDMDDVDIDWVCSVDAYFESIGGKPS